MQAHNSKVLYALVWCSEKSCATMEGEVVAYRTMCQSKSVARCNLVPRLEYIGYAQCTHVLGHLHHFKAALLIFMAIWKEKKKSQDI